MLLWDVLIFNNQFIGYATKLPPTKHVRAYNNYCNLILALKHSTFLLLYNNIPSIIILKYTRIDCGRKTHDMLLTG